jgi:hypothetical protein
MEFIDEENPVLNLLKTLSISATTISHAPAFTVEEQNAGYFYFILFFCFS